MASWVSEIAWWESVGSGSFDKERDSESGDTEVEIDCESLGVDDSDFEEVESEVIELVLAESVSVGERDLVYVFVKVGPGVTVSDDRVPENVSVSDSAERVSVCGFDSVSGNVKESEGTSEVDSDRVAVSEEEGEADKVRVSDSECDFEKEEERDSDLDVEIVDVELREAEEDTVSRVNVSRGVSDCDSDLERVSSVVFEKDFETETDSVSDAEIEADFVIVLESVATSEFVGVGSSEREMVSD